MHTTSALFAGERIFDGYKAAAERIGCTDRYLQNSVKNGTGPVHLRPSPRKIFFRESDLLRWIRSWKVVA